VTDWQLLLLATAHILAGDGGLLVLLFAAGALNITAFNSSAAANACCSNMNDAYTCMRV
jgi:hypothetical protein